MDSRQQTYFTKLSDYLACNNDEAAIAFLEETPDYNLNFQQKDYDLTAII